MQSPEPTGDKATDTRSRILDAALARFAEGGYAATSVRSIAAAASVSAPLVIHHFGDKDGLRKACDQRLLDRLEELGVPLLRGELPDLDDGARASAEVDVLTRYLIAVVREGGEIAQSLFNKLAEQNLEILGEGVATGAITPTDDERARSALTVVYSLSQHLLADLVAGYFDRAPGDPDLALRLGRQSVALFTRGLFVDERLLELFIQNHPDPSTHPTTGSPGNGAAASTSAESQHSSPERDL